MSKERLRKKGISLVALVVTIIVLIILTGAVVITGISVPKKAQLTVFYNNVATVQDAVSLQMMNNMMKKATDGSTSKWEGILDETTGEVEFTERIEELGEVELAKISRELLDKTTLADEEKEKYYVDNKGTVYYEGFDYEGDTYYNQNRKEEGTALPRVRITADTGVVTNAESITYTIRFSKNVSGFTKEDIKIDGATNTIEIIGSGAEYTLVVPTREEDYTQIVRVEANVCQDVEGNGNREGSKTITIDREKPVVTDETSTTAYTITIKATDGVGIIGYAVTNTNTPPTEFESCTSTTELTQEVTGKTPSTTYYVWVKDISGNVSEGKEVTTAQQPITREDIVAHPDLYYGETVNYKQANGDAFKDINGDDIEWRIFYADNNNIYITTTGIVDSRSFSSRAGAMKYLNCEPDGEITNASAYINDTYADISKTKNGIDFTTFAASYNVAKDAYNAANNANLPMLNLQDNGGEGIYKGFYTEGVSNDANATSGYNRYVSRLSGTKQADLYNWGGSNYYWLASPSASYSDRVLNASCGYSRVGDRGYSLASGVRPLVCLKSEVQLEKNGNAYNISMQ